MATYSRAKFDPFLERFFSRIPEDVALSFSEDQLRAIKRAFVHTEGRGHSVDLRLSFWFLTRFYMVLLLGPERRDRARRRRDRGAHPVGTLANLVMMVVFVGVIGTSVLGLLYLLKSLLGIDLIPDMSLGIWQAVREQFQFMLR